MRLLSKAWEYIRAWIKLFFFKHSKTYVKSELEAMMIVTQFMENFSKEKVIEEANLIDIYIRMAMDKRHKYFSYKDFMFFVNLLKRIASTELGKAYLIYYVMHDASIFAKIHSFALKSKSIFENSSELQENTQGGGF